VLALGRKVPWVDLDRTWSCRAPIGSVLISDSSRIPEM
jgi:hypothetical protein